MEEILMCRVCLATDVRMYNMHTYDLVRAYENITGFKMTKLRNLPVHMCTFCTAVLLKCVSFKERCGRAVDVLNSMLISSGLVPHSDITNIRRLNKLELPYTSQVEVLLIKEEDEDTDRVEYDVDDGDDKSRMFDDEDINVNCGGDDGVAAYADVCDDSTSIADIKDIDIIENEPEMIKIEKESSPAKENIVKELEFEHIDIELITLSKEEQIQEVQARKFSVNYQNSMYKCDKCFKGFITDATYKNHMYRHDPASGAHSCEACHTRWASARALRSHVVAAHARKFVCRLCAHVTRSANSAREHAHWHNGHTFRCNVCGSTFAKSTSYLTHLRLQHPSKHRCELCGESFLGVNGLKIHKKKSHRNSQDQLKARKKKLSAKEAKLKKKEYDRKRREKMKSTPENLEEYRQKERDKYHNKIKKGQVKPISVMSSREKRLKRSNWKKNSKTYRDQKTKIRKNEKEKTT